MGEIFFSNFMLLSFPRPSHLLCHPAAREKLFWFNMDRGRRYENQCLKVKFRILEVLAKILLLSLVIYTRVGNRMFGVQTLFYLACGFGQDICL